MTAKPSSQVLWYKDNELIDSTFEEVANQSDVQSIYLDKYSQFLHKPFVCVRNVLVLTKPLRRSHLLQKYRCVAYNTILVEPIELTIRLDMICTCLTF